MTVTSLVGYRLAFKLKTNAPKRYAVRPIYGSIDPKGSCDIYVKCDGPIVKTDQFMLQLTSLERFQAGIAIDSHFWSLLSEDSIYIRYVDCIALPRSLSPSPSLGAGSESVVAAAQAPLSRTASFESLTSVASVRSSLTADSLPMTTAATATTILSTSSPPAGSSATSYLRTAAISDPSRVPKLPTSLMDNHRDLSRSRSPHSSTSDGSDDESSSSTSTTTATTTTSTMDASISVPMRERKRVSGKHVPSSNLSRGKVIASGREVSRSRSSQSESGWPWQWMAVSLAFLLLGLLFPSPDRLVHWVGALHEVLYPCNSTQPK